MDVKTTAAVANLQAAVKDYPRGTKRHKPRARGAHEQWGALVLVVAGDLANALESVPADRRWAELAAPLGKFPAEMAVTVCADDVFDLLDQVEKSP
jgi:hypothetical protein